MIRKKLKNVLKELPNGSYVKIGSSQGVSFFYCDKIKSKERLLKDLDEIDFNYIQTYKKRLLNYKHRLDNLEEIYNQKIVEYCLHHKDAEKIDEYVAKQKVKKAKEKESLPNKILSLSAKIHKHTHILERNVIDVRKGISPDEPNCTIIYINGIEKGAYWTVKEYQDRKNTYKRGIHDEPNGVR